MYFMSAVGMLAGAHLIADDPAYDAGVYMEVSIGFGHSAVCIAIHPLCTRFER
jgi:hypothetical protein